MRPALKAELVLGGAVLAHLVIVETLYFTAGAGKNDVLSVARFFGLHVAAVMMVQVVLVARLPWLDRRLGMDRLTAWHRWVGIALAWTIATHATLAVLGFARLDDAPVLDTFQSLAGVTASLLGMCAAAIVVVVVAVSTRWARRRLPYEVFRYVHLLLYVAIGLALVHQALEGTAFTQSPLAAAYWWTMWALAIGSLLVFRAVVPIRRNLRHRFRVAAVVPESDDVVSVHVTGRDLHLLPGRAGQFYIWRFPGHFGWWQANPFSLSAAPGGETLRLTAKAVGATSAGLRQVPVGTRALLEGPYGAFTSLQQVTPAALLIAGGIGVTPIRALLEEAPPEDAVPTIVIYRVSSAADAVLLPELEALAAERGADLRLLAGRSGEGEPPIPRFDAASLVAMVPDIAQRDVYVCGPPPMTEAVVAALRELGLPRSQVHYERFGLG